MDKHNPYGGDAMLDDAALLLNKLAARCSGCKNVTRNQYLTDGKCPVCNGSSASQPGIPNYGTNGGVRCDRVRGPCACGAWH